MIFLWIGLGILAVLIIWFIAVFNGIVTLRNRTQEAWSDIDVQLKRRHDLIPNLIETVKGYAKHEKELFEKVTEARASAMKAQGPAESGKAENMLTDTLKSLFAVAENYPQLRASENFQKLQDELTDTENKIEAARRFYNGNVRDFNIQIQTFPNSLVAGMTGSKAFELFQMAEGEKETPQVKF
ncbi:MAG: LemA family protein [Berkelbacteria bacterium GW2011_GWB1_38_5]|uniref:LemA family protein n=1 Tax=Berkelbacteria bacterium GW2011_GWB1_38_5 TaxID=1618336 RepID=A0A0G0KDM6_9BACT|nr:MAG: LemA family protein [Berkelbacteria bacterium GW2011_GWB1_38_5]